MGFPCLPTQLRVLVLPSLQPLLSPNREQTLEQRGQDEPYSSRQVYHRPERLLQPFISFGLMPESEKVSVASAWRLEPF